MDYVTPFALTLLIHYHCSPSPYPNRHLPLVKKITDRFLQDGIIFMYEKDSYCTTKKGTDWLCAMCGTPYPVENEENQDDSI